MGENTKYTIAGQQRKPKVRRWSLIAVILVLIICVIIAVVLAVVLRSHSEEQSQKKVTSSAELLVDTHCGPVEGVVEKSSNGYEAVVFKGIPYAKPPVGKLRWKPPEELEKSKTGGQCWKGVFKATKFGSLCTQPSPSFDTKVVYGSEDCLSLNVWKPRGGNTSLLPVVLWIHGGGLLAGTSFLPGYCPNAAFVNKLNVVAVSVNYRLNAFGFLTLDVLSSDSPSNSSGNYGIQDMILSLKWIQQNIKAFGGDPDLVTILGHSGGGKAVYALIASPSANGLFHRAIPMSGPAIYTRTYKEASEDNLVFIERANCSRKNQRQSLECLYNLTAPEVIRAIPWHVFPYWSLSDSFNLPVKGRYVATFTVIDPVVVPVSPLELAYTKDTGITPVPTLVTTMEQEMDSLAHRNLSLLTYQEFAKHLDSRLGTFWDSLTNDTLNLYLPKTKRVDKGLAYINMASDVRVTCPTNYAVQKLSEIQGSKVYQLVIENRPTQPVFNFWKEYIYAYHGWDTFALFDFETKGSGGLLKPIKASKRELKFKEDLQAEFAHFIKYGSPRLKEWKTYPNNVAVHENDGIVVRDVPYREKYCSFWKPGIFLKYGWVL